MMKGIPGPDHRLRRARSAGHIRSDTLAKLTWSVHRGELAEWTTDRADPRLNQRWSTRRAHIQVRQGELAVAFHLRWLLLISGWGFGA